MIEDRLIVFIDESGISERPTRVRTWALKGHMPVVQSHFNWNHGSVIAGLLFVPAARGQYHIEQRGTPYLRCLRPKAIPPFVQRGHSYQRCWNNTSFDSRTTSPLVAVIVAS